MQKLKKYLIINAFFSGATGLLMTLFARQMHDFFHVSGDWFFPFLGLNLMVFALFVGYVSRKKLSDKRFVNLISGLDALWVLGSWTIILFRLFDLSAKGYVSIAIVSLWVAFLGYKQFKNNHSS